MPNVEQPTHVDLACFRCDRVVRKKLSELNFGNLRDYRCTGCGCTGTVHVIAVKTAMQSYADPSSVQGRVRGR